MSNKFETFRDTIIETLKATCVKVSEDLSRTSYTWSMEHAFRACGEACKFEDVTKLPGDLKDVIRFEFNKLKADIVDNKDWQHKRSTVSFALADGSIEQRRSDLFGNANISIAQQLHGARVLLDKVGKSIAKPVKNQETHNRLLKRQRNLVKEIDFLTGEIERQAKLVKRWQKPTAQAMSKQSMQ